MLIAGGTGLVGRAAIGEALSRPAIASVVAPLRRSVAMPELAPHLDAGRLSLPIAADLSAPPASLFDGVTAVGCAIGTTMKKAGSREAFEATDRALVVAFARAAQEAGVRAFAYVSSVGADPHARNFYLKEIGRAHV